MSGKLVGVAFAMGILVLVVALVFPTLVAAPGSEIDHTTEINENETQEISDVFELAVTDIDAANDTADVEITDADTRESRQTTISESQTETVTLSGESISLTLENVDTETATIMTSYPSMYGWSEPATLFAENFGVIFALLAVTVVFGLLMAVMS